jgi:hypothetical protein
VFLEGALKIRYLDRGIARTRLLHFFFKGREVFRILLHVVAVEPDVAPAVLVHLLADLHGYQRRPRLSAAVAAPAGEPVNVMERKSSSTPLATRKDGCPPQQVAREDVVLDLRVALEVPIVGVPV